MRFSILIACILLLGWTGAASAQSAMTCDVCVYGATPAGIAAAVAAAREGSKVTLLEPSPMVGGVMSGGLSFSDSNQTAREALKGIFEEIHLRIEQHYRSKGVELPYDVSIKDNRPWVYEPHVAEKVFHDLLNESGVQVLTEQQLVSVEKHGARITSLKTDKGAWLAKVFIDCSYEGDLMAAAGVSCVIGREAPSEFRESLAGHQYPKTPVGVNPLNDQGDLLPLMSSKDAGDPTLADRHVMVYSFRLCVTDQPDNFVPIPPPENYDPAQFELVRRFVKATKANRPLMDFYPLPGQKTDVNNSIGGQISLGLVGASDEWPEATPERRKEIWKDHQQYTLGLIHFLKTDPDVPQSLRDEMSRWGFCKDEFAATNHFSPALYVREARRMRGEYVLRQSDILTFTSKDDSIAVASFPIDSHDCQRVVTSDGKFVNEGTIFPAHIPGRKIGQPYEVPYRCLTPKSAECVNLLVPVCLSSTHVAMSSIRVEPSWIVIGQSAGIAAHLVAEKQIDVQQLAYPELAERLIAQKQVLHWGYELKLTGKKEARSEKVR